MTDESLRKSIRAIGGFFYFAAFLFVGSSFFAFLVLKPSNELWQRGWVLPGIVVVLAIAVFLFIVASSLRRFSPWARIVAIAISCVGMLGVPFGTVLCGPFLYVLLKSKHLFAREPQGNASPSGIDRLAA
jgi:hypothetical protein